MKKFVLNVSVLAAFLVGVVGTANAEVWRLVTDDSVLKAGDKLVLASSEKGKVAGDISNSVMSVLDATFSADRNVITSLPADAVVLTLQGTSEAWTLVNSSDQKLGATSVKRLAWNSGNVTWTIDCGENGNATIYNTEASYGRFLYNVQSPRFTTYTSNISSSMVLPQLYRQETGGQDGYVFMYEGFSGNTTRCGGGKVCEKDMVITISSGVPTKENYTFTGWLYEGAIYQPGDSFRMPASDVTLVAQWEKDTALKEVVEETNVKKVMLNGSIYIVVDGVTYDVFGRKQ